METLYGLKRKTTNRWLKLLLLLFVAVGFGVPNLNAQTKSIKVADDKQLIEAINNPSVGTIVLEAGFYPTLNTYAESGTRVAKRVIDDSNRDVLCQYYIIATDACFVGTPGVTFVSSIATAGYTDTYGCGCCPIAEDLGSWSVTSQPGGSTVTFISPLSQQENNIFSVNMPGMYILRYTWGAPYNSLVETAYYFYGPVLLDLSAPDVCGLTTEVTFTIGSIYPDPTTTVVWKLDGVVFDPDPPGNNTTSPFDLTVAECGVHELSVTATPTKCPPVTKTILIDFACQPIADAGPDVNVCDDICYYSLVGSYGGVLLSPTHAWSWIQLGGPGALIFNAQTELETGVCSQDTECPYGEFSVEFQVQNGECYDSDTMLLRFYEQPGAVAGPDQHLCNTFSFSLGAVPYIYCGQEGVNYWKHAWWELLSQPSTCEVIFDELDPLTSVAIGSCDPECAYGPYVFVWHELNVKIVDGDTLWGDSDCAASDTVVVSIYEDPAMSAGADMQFCDTFAFTLFGTADEPCNDFTVVVYSWEKTAEPGNCVVTFNEPGDLQPWVVIDQCDTACRYGEYIFALTQSTGYLDDAGLFVEVCSQTDSVTYTIFEQPLANAGPDVFECVDILYSPYCYTMVGTMDYCYTMYGVWTKSCGPGDVVLRDINDPTTNVCFPVPGRYQFIWTLSNDMCEDADTVLFDLLETPTASAEITEDMAACDELCYSLADVGITKYVYTGVNGVVNPDVECPNYWDMAHWFYVSGPCLDPAEVTFTDDTDPATELCVSYYGAYTIGWVELNKPADKDYYCSDTALVFVEFFETPAPFAGDDSTFCGNCYTLLGVPDAYLPPCNQHGDDYYYWEALPDNPCPVTFADFEEAVTTVCIPDETPCYGTYGFVLHQSNGQCLGSDTVYITFGLMPDPIPLCFWNDPNDCGPYSGPPNGGPIGRGFDYGGCINPNEVIEVCADGWTHFYSDWNCYCEGWL